MPVSLVFDIGLTTNELKWNTKLLILLLGCFDDEVQRFILTVWRRALVLFG